MWVILGLLALLLLLGVGIIGLLALLLVWRPAIQLLTAGKTQIELAKTSLATLPTRNGHPGVGPETNDGRSLELNGATDPRH